VHKLFQITQKLSTLDDLHYVLCYANREVLWLNGTSYMGSSTVPLDRDVEFL